MSLKCAENNMDNLNIKNITLIHKNGRLTIDGVIKNSDFNLEDDDLEITFLFSEDAYNLPELKTLAVGGSIVPIYQILIDECSYDALSFGAVGDSENEITCFLQKADG